MRLQFVRQRSIEALKCGGVDSARICVDWLIEEVLESSLAEVVSDPDREVSEAAVEAINRGVARRLAGEPIQYIVGWTDFFGLRILVNPNVLIPRPETEVVVEVALELMTDATAPRVLDVGSGSGCIALAIASARGFAQVVGCDVSEKALAVAVRNAERLCLQVMFVSADAESGASIRACGSEFDMIVSNPPYIPASEIATLPREVIEYEPYSALVAGDDPLRFYRALIERARERLTPGGWLVAELHSDYGHEVAALAAMGGLSEVDVRPDLAGLPRVLIARRSPADVPE